MMEQYSGDFLAAVDGLRTLLDCNGRVLPVSVEQSTLYAEYEDGSRAVSEVGVDREQTDGRRIRRIWLDPEPNVHGAASEAIRGFDAVVIGPGSFYTSLMPILLVRGVAEAVRATAGPIVLVTNILTEGRGMHGFSVGEAVRRVGDAIGRPVDVAIANNATPPPDVLARYAKEHKELAARRRHSRGVRAGHRSLLPASDRPSFAPASRLRRLERPGAAAPAIALNPGGRGSSSRRAR